MLTGTGMMQSAWGVHAMPRGPNVPTTGARGDRVTFAPLACFGASGAAINALCRVLSLSRKLLLLC